jgi:IclR family mhp operon transcriptional activator
VDEIRDAGLAAKGRNQFNNNPGKTSSIAAPIMDGDRVTGALTLVFFASALKLNDALGQFGDRIKTAARHIGEDLLKARSDAAERAVIEVRPVRVRQTPAGAALLTAHAS